jgi:hypothetical protein
MEKSALSHLSRKSRKHKAAIEQHPDLCNRIQQAWSKWVPAQRRSYLRGLFLIPLDDPDAVSEGAFLMDVLKHYD